VQNFLKTQSKPFFFWRNEKLEPVRWSWGGLRLKVILVSFLYIYNKFTTNEDIHSDLKFLPKGVRPVPQFTCWRRLSPLSNSQFSVSYAVVAPITNTSPAAGGAVNCMHALCSPTYLFLLVWLYRHRDL
jgi:hypothetical protein